MGRVNRVAGLPRLLLSAAILAAVALAACSRPAPPSPPKVEPGKSIDWWMSHLTLEEKVGQLFWFGLKDPSMGPETEQLIREGMAGGFILFARQGSDPEVLRELTGSMQALSQGRGRLSPGLVISADHEGGLVQRWLEPFTPWPGNMAIGATRSTAYADQVAAAMAEELLAVGVNMNLSPVADVNNNPANPVIGIRSFGEDPGAVARFVPAAIKGAQSRQLSAVAKHFPGHGDTDLDSHKALPAVNHPMTRLEAVELVPFQKAIEAGVDAIMTAHVIFPAVEPDGLPATLSPSVIQGLLKDKLGFQGVVMTDAIDTMKAITDHYGTEKGIVMAVQAGADAVLVTESYGRQAALHDVLLEAVKSGQVSEERLNDAVRRQLALKAKRGLLPDTGPNAGKGLAAPAEALGTEAHRQLAFRVGAEALTLVRNKHLPLKLAPEQQLLVVGPAYGAAPALSAGISEQHANMTEVRVDRKLTPAQADTVRTASAGAAAVVYGVYNGHKYPEHQALIRRLIATGKPVLVVGLGEPYDLTELPEIQTYIAAYGYQSTNLQGVGALLFGTASPGGKLPVSVPGLYPIGHGLSF